MSEAQRAHALLREAREILSRRMTEMVLASADELLADARGDSYMNEIEGLYEQVGMKLAHVSQMLSHLPSDDSSVSSQAFDASPLTNEDPFADSSDLPQTPETQPHNFLPGDDSLPALLGPLYVASHGLPSAKHAAPAAHTTTREESASPASLGRFVKQVQMEDLPAAGRTLGTLLGIEFRRAVACAAAFAEQLQEDPHFFFKAAQLQMELQVGSFKGARALLIECFALTSDEATAVLYNQPSGEA